MIHITDGESDEILDVIPDEEYWNENHHKSLKDTLETFEFTTFANKRYSKYLTKRNRVIISDDDGSFVEFIIYESIKYRDSNGHVMEVYARASYLEDLQKGKVIRPGKTGNKTNIQHANETLLGTLWKAGNILYAGSRDFLIENFTNPYSFSKKLASEFELELQFRLEIEGSKIIGRYMDMVDRIGTWRGREVEFGKDLLGIKRRETGEIVTALLGIGPEKEDGTRLEVLVEDQEALQRWGRGQHIIEPYEPQSMDSNMSLEELTRYTRAELNKRINSLFEYETTIANLESVPGLENQEIRFGDTIKIKDPHFNPPLYLEARIHTMDRSPKDKSKKTVTLGDYIEYTEEEVQANWKAMQAEISKKVSQAQLEQFAEPKKVISNDPPEDTNVIWIKPTDSIYIPYAYNDSEGDWAKMSPTAAEEINGVEKNKEYNGTKISDIEGMISTRKDNLVRVILNAEYGFIVQERRTVEDQWENILFFDFDDKKYKFSGGVEGVTGTFGQVSVRNGDLLLVDEVSGTETVVRENSNMVADHSFELLLPAAQITPIGQRAGVFSIAPETFMTNPWSNSNQAQARMLVSFDASTETLFGQRAAILRGLSYGTWDQLVYIPSQFRQTKALSLSAYVAPFELTTANVQVSMRMQLVTTAGAWVQDLASRNFNIDYTKKYDWTKLSVTYNGDIPTGDYRIRIRLFLNNDVSSAFLLCDGVQLVPFKNPALYHPENQLYRLATGIDQALELNSVILNSRTANLENLWVGTMQKKAHAFLNLLNGWVAYGGSYQAPRYTQMADGMVHLSGLMKDGLVGSYTAAVLPVGCRPNQTETFSVAGSSAQTLVYVYANGDIRVTVGGNGNVSLSGISFLGER